MMICLLRVLFGGWALLLCPLLPAAPAPMPKTPTRTLEEDVALLVQIRGENGNQWDGKPINIEKPVKILGAEVISPITPVFVFVKGDNGIGVEFKGKDEFLKKAGKKGLLMLCICSPKGGWQHFSYYRFEERDKQRFLVIPDMKGGEIAFTYEIDGKILKLKGGKMDGFQHIGSAKLAGDYTLQERAPQKE